MEDESQSTTVEFHNTVDDFIRFDKCWHTRKRTTKVWLGYALALATGVVMGHALVGPQLTARSFVYRILCIGVLLAAWWVFVYGLAPVIARMTMRRSAAKFLGTMGKRRIFLDAGGVHETSDATQGAYRWHIVDAVEADKNCIFIFLLGGTGWVIPRRAFLDTAASEAFFTTARRLHAQVASTRPAEPV
jgi:hypothetical protein